MLFPKKNKLVHNFFSWYISFIINKDFEAFNYKGIDFQRNKSVLLLANHYSWWDGFLMFFLNKIFFKKNFHVLVNTQNYKSVSFLKYLGAFAYESKATDLITTLNYAGDLLNETNNLVLIFPQGKLYSNHVQHFEVEKGVMHIIKSSKKEFNLILSTTFIDYFSKRKPSAYNYLKCYAFNETLNFSELKESINNHYKDSINQHSKITE